MRCSAAATVVLLAACGTSSAPAPRSVRLLSPADVGPVVLTGLELPVAGTLIGGHFHGAGYAVRQSSYHITEAVRTRWALDGRLRGERILRLAGYFVENVDPSSSDARRINADFGLSGRVAGLEVRSTGNGAPFDIDAQVEIAWELLDIASGAVIVGRNVRGGARFVGTMDSAVGAAIDQSLERLLADSVFQMALSVPRDDFAGTTTRGWRDVPGPGEIIELTESDLNTSRDSAALERVAWGVVSLHGTGGGYFGSAFLLTRDGLGLTSFNSMRAARRSRDVRVRLVTGVERPVRLLRRDAQLNVALIQVQCPGDCPTVDWRAPAGVPPSTHVMIVGSRGTSLIISPGMVGGRWGVAYGLTLETDTGAAGEPIATPGQGRVFAMVGGLPGQTTAITLEQIFRALRIRSAEGLRTLR